MVILWLKPVEKHGYVLEISEEELKIKAPKHNHNRDENLTLQTFKDTQLSTQTKYHAWVGRLPKHFAT